MLLCGSFQNQVIRLINMLRFDEKQLSQLSKSAADSPREFFSEVDRPQNESTLEENEDFEDDNEAEDLEEGSEAGSISRKDWRRVRKDYVRSKQYIFVAATLPVNGKKTAGALLKHMFPDANWISGNYLHRHNPRCHTPSSLLSVATNKLLLFFR